MSEENIFTLDGNSYKEEDLDKTQKYLIDQILILRDEIIDIVLLGEARNRIPVHLLKTKAKLIKKYSRRLKLLKTIKILIKKFIALIKIY